MRILLHGAGTNNKGAELMLYAVLQEIERSHPNAKVYLHKSSLPQGRNYILSNVDIKLFLSPFYWFLFNRLRINQLLKKLHINKVFVPNPPSRHIDYFFDLSGLLFSDQRNLTSDRISILSETLRKYHNDGMRIVYLPQAFGPIDKKNTKQAIGVLSKYSSLVFSRERKSYEYLCDSGLMDMSKVKVSTDFTSLVHGVSPERYSHLKNAVCIIPNRHMIDRGGLSFQEYAEVLKTFISIAQENGQKVFILNHEGDEEESFIRSIMTKLGIEVELVSGLNALETKGIISESYLVISARYHGVASALNSGVPCLATSWNHKYAFLFKDYGINDGILSQTDLKAAKGKIEEYLNPETNYSIRAQLKQIVPDINRAVNNMWGSIWNMTI